MTNREEWKNEHQEFEFNYHAADNYRWHDEQFVPEWRENFGNFIGVAPDHFSDADILIDVGSGSRSALASYFTRGRIVNLDPLASRYLEIPEVAQHWTPELRSNFLSQPAEGMVQAFRRKCSLVVCWNVLDHVYNWRAVLANVLSYAAPGGIVALCSDTKSHGVGHPGIDDPGEMFQTIADRTEIRRLELNYGKTVVRDFAAKLIKTERRT
jgi:2-polyprenyl-3-methyl-5-hydroxy-6-metoxy-1,4-benzoquinol methylase